MTVPAPPVGVPTLTKVGAATLGFQAEAHRLGLRDEVPTLTDRTATEAQPRAVGFHGPEIRCLPATPLRDGSIAEPPTHPVHHSPPPQRDAAHRQATVRSAFPVASMVNVSPIWSVTLEP